MEEIKDVHGGDSSQCVYSAMIIAGGDANPLCKEEQWMLNTLFWLLNTESGNCEE